MAHGLVTHGNCVGYQKTSTYTIWNMMRERCNNEKATSYPNYGARGINVCPRWDSFDNFLEDMGDRPEGYFLDRKDTDGEYSPDNCKWSTHQEQNRNKRNCRRFEFAGENLLLCEWSEKLGIKRSTLAQRLYVYGWSVEKTLTKV